MGVEGGSGGGWWRREYWGLLPLVVLLLLTAIYFASQPSTAAYSVAGVKVVSEIPLEEFQKPRYDYIALYNDTVTNAELTCKFGLSAVSQPDRRGYRVRIGEGDTGIYLGRTDASIKGASQQDILDACHAFICLREGINCTDFSALAWFVRNADSMSVILDSSGGMETGRGYAEIVGVLSFVQSVRVDRNGDGLLNQSEIDANEFFIYPFLMSNGTCAPQPLRNLVENWAGGNETYNCSVLEPAIVLRISDEKSIRVEGKRIILSGDDRALHDEAIIVRDSVAPEWVRRIYGYT